MNKALIILFVLFLVSGFVAECQDFVTKPVSRKKKTLSYRVKKKDKKYSYFVSADSIEPSYLRHLYMEFENPLTIAVSDVPNENIYVTFNRGLISGENGKYVVIPLYEGDFARPNGTGNVEIYVKTDSGKSERVAVVEFDLISAPGVIADVGGRCGGKIPKEFLLSQSYLNISQAPFPFYTDKDLSVIMFSVVCMPSLNSQRDDWIGVESGVNVFTDNMIKMFKRLQPGDCVVFQTIGRIIQNGYRKGQRVGVNPVSFQIE